MTKWMLFTALCFYNWVDYHNTLILLQFGAEEMNPLLNYLIDYTGTDEVIGLAKLVVLIVVFVVIAVQQKSHNHYS